MRREKTAGREGSNEDDNNYGHYSMATASSVEESARMKLQGRKLLPSIEQLFPVFTELEITVDWRVTGVGLLVETLQLIGLTFNPNFHWGPVFGTVIAKIVYFFDFPLFDPQWASNTFPAGNLFFWLFLAILLGIVTCVLMYAGEDSQRMPARLAAAVKVAIHATVSFAELPVAMTFASFLACVNGNTSGAMYWYAHEQRCLRGYGIALFIFGAVGLVLLLGVLAIAALFLFDDIPNSRSLLARPGCAVFAATTAVKFIVAILFHTLLSTGHAQPFAATLCALLGVLGVAHALLLPYYNLRVNQYRAAQMFLGSAFAAVAAADVPKDSTWHKKSISTVVVLLAGVAVFALGWFATLARVNSAFLRRSSKGSRAPRHSVLIAQAPEAAVEGQARGAGGSQSRTALPCFRDSRCYPKNLPVNDLVLTRFPGIEELLWARASPADASGESDGDGEREMEEIAVGSDDVAKLSLTSTLRQRGRKSGNPRRGEHIISQEALPFMQPYVTAVYTQSDVELSTRFLREYCMQTGATAASVPRALCAFAARIYTKGMVRYSKEPGVAYQFCLFLAIYAKRVSMSLAEVLLLHANRRDQLSVTLSYRVYRLTEQLKRMLKLSSADVIRHQVRASEAHKEMLFAFVSFWGQLANITSNSNNGSSNEQLVAIADFITTKRDECKRAYAKTLQTPDEKVLLSYAQFLRDVMLNDEHARLLTQRVIEEAKNQLQQRQHEEELLWETERNRGGRAVKRHSSDGNEQFVAHVYDHVNDASDAARWQACFTDLRGTGGKESQASLLYDNGQQYDGEAPALSGIRRGVRRLRVAVYATLLVLTLVVLGLVIFFVIRVFIVQKMVERIYASTNQRSYIPLAIVLVGQIVYLQQLGLPEEQLIASVGMLKTNIGYYAQLVYGYHHRLMLGDLYTSDIAITSFVSEARTEIIQPGVLSLEGNKTRTLVDAFNLGFQLASTLAAIAANPLSATLPQDSVDFILLNAAEGNFGKVFNHTVDLYVQQRTQFLTDSVWVVIAFVMVGIFLVLSLFALVKVWIRRVELSKLSSIRLFTLIPAVYVEELYRSNKAKVRQMERVEVHSSPGAVALSLLQSSKNATYAGARTPKDMRTAFTGSSATNPLVHSPHVSLPLSKDGKGSFATALDARQRARSPPLGGMQPSSLASVEFAASDARNHRREDAGWEENLDIKHIEQCSATDDSDHRVASNDQASWQRARTQDGGVGERIAGFDVDERDQVPRGQGDQQNTPGSSLWKAMQAVARVATSHAALLIYLTLSVVLSVVSFAVAFRLQAVSTELTNAIAARTEFFDYSGKYYTYMSTLGQDAQQYVVTGDIVHVERYADYLYAADINQWLNTAIVTEKNPNTVAAIVNIRVVINSALQRQQIALWLASLYYNVSSSRKDLFAKVYAMRRDYDYVVLTDVMTAAFAKFNPTKPTLTATTPDVDAALAPADQFTVARNLVFDDYYQAHRFLMAEYLNEMMSTHEDDYSEKSSQQKRLWTTAVVLGSLVATFFVLSLVALTVQQGSVVGGACTFVCLLVLVAWLVCLGLLRDTMRQSDAIVKDYDQFLSSANSSRITLAANQDYAIRVQQFGYTTALTDWAATRGQSAFNESINRILYAYTTTVSANEADSASAVASQLHSLVQHIVYYTDISVVLSTTAYGMSTTEEMQAFQYRRRLESGYETDLFHYGNSPMYYVSRSVDETKTPEEQLVMSLKAASGARHESVVKSYSDSFASAVSDIDAAMTKKLHTCVTRMGARMVLTTAIASALLGVVLLTFLYSVYAAFMPRARELSSTLVLLSGSMGVNAYATVVGEDGADGGKDNRANKRGSVGEGHAGSGPSSSDTKKGIQVRQVASTQRRRREALVLIITTVLLVVMFTALLVVGWEKNSYELSNSQLFNDIKARDWGLMETVIRAQHMWLNIPNLLEASPFVIDLLRSLSSALTLRQNLYLGDGGETRGLLAVNAKQNVALFGSTDYQWKSYQTMCSTFEQLSGYVVMDFTSVGTTEMYARLFTSGTENVVWQFLALSLQVLQAKTAAETLQYELPFLLVFPALALKLNESSTTYFEDRMQAGDSMLAAFLAVACIVIVVVPLLALLVFRPFLQHLMNEEEGMHLLLRMIPENVRRDVPIIANLLRTGGVNEDAELIAQACQDLQSTALLVIAQDDTILSATDEALRQFQRLPENTIGARLEILLSDERAAELARHREVFGCSSLSALAGKEGRTVGRRSDGTIFPIQISVREVFTTSAVTSSSLNGDNRLAQFRHTSKTTATVSTGNTGGGSVFIVCVNDIEVKSYLEFARRVQQSVFDNCRQCQLVIDTQNTICMINASALRLFGYAASELHGHSLSVLLRNDAVREQEAAMEELVSQSRAFNASITIMRRVIARRKDQREIHLDMQLSTVVSQLPSGSSEIIFTVVHIRDVSNDLFIQQAEFACKAVIDLSPVPVIVIDESSRVITFSAAAEKSWGCKAENVIGCPLHDLMCPSDSGILYDFTHGPHSDLKHFLGTTRTLEAKRRDTGARFLVEVRLRQLKRVERGRGGRPVETFMYVGFFKDLSLETLLSTRNIVSQSTFDSCPSPIVVSDELGRIVAVNAAAEHTFDYRASQLIGEDVGVLMPDHIAQRHASYIELYRTRGMQRNVAGVPRNEFARRSDGRLFAVEIVLKEVRVKDFLGSLSDAVGMAHATSAAVSAANDKHRRDGSQQSGVGPQQASADGTARKHDSGTSSSTTTTTTTTTTGDGAAAVGGRKLLVAFMRDTTLEHQLTRTNSVHEAIIRQSPVPMMSVSADGVIRLVNVALEKLFCYAERTLVGRNAGKLLFAEESRSDGGTGSNPATEATPPNEFADLLRASRVDGTVKRTLLAHSSDRHTFPVEVCVQVLQRGEDRYAHLNLESVFVISLLDMTREVETSGSAFLERAVVSAYPGSIMVINDRGAVRFLSNQARHLFGIALSATTVGLHISSLLTNAPTGAEWGASAADSADATTFRASATVPFFQGSTHAMLVEEIIAAAAAAQHDGVLPHANINKQTDAKQQQQQQQSAIPQENAAGIPTDAEKARGLSLQGVRADGATFSAVVHVRRLPLPQSNGSSAAATALSSVFKDPQHGLFAKAEYASAGGAAGAMESRSVAGSEVADADDETDLQQASEVTFVLLIHERPTRASFVQTSAIRESILEHVGLSTARIDRTGGILSVNAAFLETFRFSSGREVVGRNIKDALSLTVTDANGGNARGVDDLIASGAFQSQQTHELVAVRADGSRMHVGVNVSDLVPAADESLSEASVRFVFLHDISVAVQLRSRKNLFNELLASCPLAVLTVEVDDHASLCSRPIRLFNTAAQKLFQLSEEEALGYEVSGHAGIAALLTVNGRCVLDAYRERSGAVGLAQLPGRELPPIVLKVCGHRKDGSRFPATAHLMSYYDESTHQPRMLVVVEEQTAQVVLGFERATSTAIEDATPYAIVCFNEQREILLFSRQAERVFRCSETSALGTDIFALMSSATAELFQSIVKDTDAASTHSLRHTPRRFYRQVAKRVDGSDAVFLSEWVVYEASPTTVARDPSGSRILVALVRDASTAATDVIAGAVSTAAVNALGVPFVAFDDAGVISVANQSLADLFGYPSTDDLLGHSMKVLLQPSTVRQLLGTMQTVRSEAGSNRSTRKEKAASQVLSVTGRRRNGEPVSLAMLLELLPPLEGAAMTVCHGDCVEVALSTAGALSATWYGFLRDVGDQVALKKELLLSEAVAEVEGLAVLIANQEGTITFAGEGAKRLLGSPSLSGSVLENSPLSTVLPGAASFEAFVKQYGSPDGKTAAPAEMHRLGDSEAIASTVQLKEVRHGSSNVSYVCLIRGSALRTDKDDQLPLLMDAVNELALMPIVAANASSLITLANEPAAKLFGFKDASEMIGRDLGILMQPTEANSHRNQFSNYMRGFKVDPLAVGHTRRVTGTRTDGSRISLQLSVDDYTSALHGRQIIAYIQDVTDIMRRESADEAVESVMSVVPATVFIVSEDDGSILHVSASSLEQLHAKEESVLGLPLTDFVTSAEGNSTATLLATGTKNVNLHVGRGSNGLPLSARMTVTRLNGNDKGRALVCFLHN